MSSSRRILTGEELRVSTAVITALDILAVGAMRFLYEQGLSIPGDISVTGYEDGQATFSIGEDDRLAWADAKENAGADMAFERAEIVGFAPTAEEFAFSYFNMIGDGELSMDKKACEALNFAADSELWHADRAAMRDNMFMAWEGLSETEQSAFDDSFMDVVHLLDACYADWAANRATFTDGRDERMDELLAEPLYQEAWQTLLGNTLTLGNSEG